MGGWQLFFDETGVGEPQVKKGRLILASLASVALLLGTIGCGAPTPGDSNFNLIFKYGVGATNELNTFNGTFTKDMIMEPSIKVKLSLSEEELDSIYQKMVEIDFFNYPDRFSVTVPPGESIIMVTPYESYYFKVRYDSRVKELWWEDEIKNENIEADRLRELIELIWSIIQSKEEYKKLPPPKGGYL